MKKSVETPLERDVVIIRTLNSTSNIMAKDFRFVNSVQIKYCLQIWSGERMTNYSEIHEVFWFWIVLEILEMPKDIFINIRPSIKSGDGWRWK